MKDTMIKFAAAAGMALAASAFAQNATKERELKGDPNKPLGGATTIPGGESHTSLMMSRQENGEDVVVKIENGETTATRNGKPVPADKIRKSDNKIEILGDNGEVLSTFHIGITSGDRNPLSGRGWRVLSGRNGLAQSPTVTVRQPKVMIGVNMSAADGKLAEHLGLKGGGVVLDSVIDGLPAAKAGLKAHDVIVEINGKRDINEDTIRDELKGKNPGDAVKVKYIRQGGNEQEATVTLDAYDAGKLGNIWQKADVVAPDAGNDPFVWPLPLGAGQVQIDQKKLREALEQAMKELDDNHAKFEDMKAEVRKHLDDAMKELARSQEQIQNQTRELRDMMRIENLPRMRMLDNNRGLIVAPHDLAEVQPAQPVNPQAENQMKDKFDRILDNLERLNKRLDDLEKRVGDKK